MAGFIMKRLLFAVITIWIVATLTFILMHNLPGGPFTSQRVIPAQILDNLNEKYGLDKPLISQYATYMGNLIRGDLGLSMQYPNRSVNSIIRDKFPVSADLGVRALLITLVAGITIGIFSALMYKRFFDYMSLTIAILGVSVPGFAIGAMVQYFLCYKFSGFIQNITGSEVRLLPVTGWEGFSYTVGPSIALSFGAVGIIIRMMRASMLDVMSRNYITAARANGLNEKEIVLKHAFRNAVLPVLTAFGPIFTSIILGSFVVENIFSVPGLGKYFVTSIQDKDYTMIMGLSIFTTLMVIMINTVLDILYTVLDPRIKMAKEKRGLLDDLGNVANCKEK
jgi:oligopeptide transport system permease protein